MAKKKTVRGRVTVYPRREVLDPQGKAILHALERSGFARVREVRAGKSFEIELEASSAGQAEEELAEMGRKLLANPVIEDFSIELLRGTTS